ncbi:MAG: hypothetical protein ACOCRX_08700 [Candidatus Woesearchaeota archaeon]
MIKMIQKIKNWLFTTKHTIIVKDRRSPYEGENKKRGDKNEYR